MFDVSSSEFLLVMVIALVVIGPKDLPKVLRFLGKWIGKARAVTSQFRSGFDEMVRQSELQELEQKWKAENDRIMAEHPSQPAPVDLDPVNLDKEGRDDEYAPDRSEPLQDFAHPQDATTADNGPAETQSSLHLDIEESHQVRAPRAKAPKKSKPAHHVKALPKPRQKTKAVKS
jgi:sec-independent protein translocase protein TatB